MNATGQHLDRVRIIASFVAILLALSAALIPLVWASTLRSDGLSGYLEAGGYRVTRLLKAMDTIRAGDLVVAIDGRPLSQDLNDPGVWARFLAGRSSGSYTIERAGERLPFDIVRQPLSIGQLLQRVAPYGLIALFFFAIFGMSLCTDADTTVLPFLMAAAWIWGMNTLLNGIPRLGAAVNVALAWLYSPLVLISFGLGTSLFVHILLIYPERKRWVIRYPWGPYVFHGLNIFLALVAWGGAGSGSLLANRIWIVRTLLKPISVIEILIGAGSLIHTYVRSRQRGARNKAPLLMWGVMPGVATWLFLHHLPVMFSGHPRVPLWAADLPLVLVVLSFVISMSRRALMMVDLWVNRALVYGTLVGLLIGFFLLTTWSLGVLTPFDRRWSVLITVALIGIITPSLHHAIQEGVNHIFFKEWLSARALFRDVSMELSTTLETEALTRILVTELPHRLRVTQAALFLQQPDGNLKAVDDSSGWPIPADHPLLRALVEVQSPLILSQTHDLSPLLRDLRDENWEIILPLRSGGALVGLYLLGVHLSGEFYGRSELETLSMLGERIGLTLENARLYEEVERYSENLEKLVWQRTEDLQNANRALSAERDRLQVILQNIADGLVYITPGGEVALANTAFEMMVGRTAGGMLGKTPTEADIPSFVNDLVSEARVDRGMVLTQDQDLGDRVLRLSVIGLPEHGGVIAVLRDITRDVEVDRMKSQFLSAVSHELRTPLTSILGFAKITRKFVDDRLMPDLVENEGTHQIGERVRTNLEIIAVEGHRLMALIDDVLEITAFDAGTADWDDRPCALSSLIQDAIETQREAAEAKGLRLQARISQDLPMMVVDPDRVTQLLRNLISNAVKLTKDGEVELSVGFLEPGTSIQDWHTPDSGAVLVAVRDTGLGLDFDQGAQVFERFSQIDALMDAKPTRTGLGLAICQEIVSHYKGILWVESDPDRGSTFSFTLPVGKQAEPVR